MSSLSSAARNALNETIPGGGSVGDVLDQVSDAVANESSTVTVGSGTTQKDVTLQLKDAAGNSIASKRLVNVWVSDAAGGAITSSAPSGGISVQTGTLLVGFATSASYYVAESPDVFCHVVSDANGQIVVRLSHTGAATTWYVNFGINGRIISSAAVQVGT